MSEANDLKRFTGTVYAGCRYTGKDGCWMEAGETFTGYFIGSGKTAEGRAFLTYDDEEGAFLSVWLDEVSIEFGGKGDVEDVIDLKKPLSVCAAKKILVSAGFSHHIVGGAYVRYSMEDSDSTFIDICDPPGMNALELMESVSQAVAMFNYRRGVKVGRKAGSDVDSEKPLKENDAVKLLARFGFTYSHSVESGSFSRYNTTGAPGNIHYVDLYHPPQQSLFNLLEDINLVIADFHFSRGQKEEMGKAKEDLDDIIESWELRGRAL